MIYTWSNLKVITLPICTNIPTILFKVIIILCVKWCPHWNGIQSLLHLLRQLCVIVTEWGTQKVAPHRGYCPHSIIGTGGLGVDEMEGQIRRGKQSTSLLHQFRMKLQRSKWLCDRGHKRITEENIAYPHQGKSVCATHLIREQEGRVLYWTNDYDRL